MPASFSQIGLVVADLAASLAFYRRLGLDIPTGSDTAPHVDAQLPGGLRLAWDPIGRGGVAEPRGTRRSRSS